MSNTLYPGRKNYSGPTKGWFGLLHHDKLLEESNDVMNRVAYVKDHKPEKEIAIRLHNMIYLGHVLVQARASLDADCQAKLASLYADYAAKRDSLYADYAAKRDSLDAEILSYIQSQIPDCAWDGKELTFTKAIKGATK